MFNIKPMKPFETHYLLNTLYNIEMGLFNHLAEGSSAKEPLAVIRAFKEENQKANSLLDEVAFRYKTNKIWERFKISFLDYIKLPVTKARELDDISIRVLKPIEDAEEKAKAQVFNQGLENIPPLD